MTPRRSVGGRAEPQISPLRYPGFPVEVGGVSKHRAPFLKERRTRCTVQSCVAGNPCPSSNDGNKFPSAVCEQSRARMSLSQGRGRTRLSEIGGPMPIPYLWHILQVLPDIFVVLEQLAVEQIDRI